jgi:MFS family permease
MARDMAEHERRSAGLETPYAWARLATALALSAVGSVGMWSVVVALPAVQADFGATRGEVSLAYSFAMVGYGLGGVLMGRLSDRFGIMVPLIVGALSCGIGFVAAAFAGNVWQFALAQGLLICMFGGAVTFGPLMADISMWFDKRRGIAIAIAASGNYMAGFLWSPIVQRMIEAVGWRETHFWIGVICVVTMLPLALVFARRAPVQTDAQTAAAANLGKSRLAGLSPRMLTLLLMISGISCCVAMSTPQVHIVAYCADLGFGAARGAEMLSIMLGFGIVSRLVSGWISDKIGGLRTLLLGVTAQAAALILYVPFDGLLALYVVSALFGLFQGGIVPSYALIVREHFSPKEAGERVGLVLMSTIFGMAIGGWMSGAIFDLTGSYLDAFANGVFWNLLAVAIALWLLGRIGGRKKERQRVTAANRRSPDFAAGPALAPAGR